jgi:hypothetical protein
VEARTLRPDTARSGSIDVVPAATEDRGVGTRRLVIVSGLGVAGALLVTAGGVLTHASDYLRSTLLEIGAALFLAVPLILLERLMEHRISGVQTEVKSEIKSVAEDLSATKTKIDQLGRDTISRIAAARASDAELLDRLRSDASEKNVWSALHRAQEFATLDHEGLRVRIPNASLRMRFNATPGDAMTAGPVEISVEDRDGRLVSGYESWSADESAEDALAQLARDLQRHNEYPGDDRFDATDIFQRLADALGTIIGMASNGRRGGPLGRVVEIDGPWALTCHGLAHVGDGDRSVPTRQILDDRATARAVLLGADDDDGQLDAVLDTAAEYHKGVAQRNADRRMSRVT